MIDTKDKQTKKFTALERCVYRKLLEVPPGKVTTYGELARAVGIKNGGRAIGNIMNKNPYPGIMPCHRVVMSTGKIGGYAYGKKVKERMLAREGIQIQNEAIHNIQNKMHHFD